MRRVTAPVAVAGRCLLALSRLLQGGTCLGDQGEDVPLRGRQVTTPDSQPCHHPQSGSAIATCRRTYATRSSQTSLPTRIFEPGGGRPATARDGLLASGEAGEGRPDPQAAVGLAAVPQGYPPHRRRPS